MFITINLSPQIIDYLDNVCGSDPNIRGQFIENLILQHYQSQPQQYIPEMGVEPPGQRLHRRQRGFTTPQAPIRQRDKFGAVRKPRQTAILRRGSQ